MNKYDPRIPGKFRQNFMSIMDNLSYSSLPKIALKSDRLGSWQKLGSTTVEFLIYDRYVFKRLPTRSSLVGEDARSEIFS